jgi:hypothetical protein
VTHLSAFMAAGLDRGLGGETLSTQPDPVMRAKEVGAGPRPRRGKAMCSADLIGPVSAGVGLTAAESHRAAQDDRFRSAMLTYAFLAASLQDEMIAVGVCAGTWRMVR